MWHENDVVFGTKGIVVSREFEMPVGVLPA
jgi:hypothetical protein